jgi:hypothetical protein
MRNPRRQQGFILLIVVLLLGLMAIGITVWAAQTKDLMIQTKLHTTQAGLDNAIASAAEWAKLNPDILKKTPPSQWIRLNTNQLRIPGLECHYRMIDNALHTEIEINAVGNFRSGLIKKTVRLSL